jgi:hypothetical protein
MRPRPRALSARVGNSCPPNLRREREHHRTARAARRRACLGRDTRTTRGAFHRLGPRPCDRGGTRRANWFACASRPGTLSRVAMGSAAVRGGGSPPHAIPALRSSASRRPPSEADKMLLTDFCNRLATCAPRRTGRFPRWRPRFHAVATSDGAYAPADDPGRDAFDDASRAGCDHASRAPPMMMGPLSRPMIRRVRTPPDPAEPPIEVRAHRWHLSYRGVVFHGRVERVDL